MMMSWGGPSWGREGLGAAMTLVATPSGFTLFEPMCAEAAMRTALRAAFDLRMQRSIEIRGGRRAAQKQTPRAPATIEAKPERNRPRLALVPSKGEAGEA